jgi:hypothetical protein
VRKSHTGGLPDGRLSARVLSLLQYLFCHGDRQFGDRGGKKTTTKRKNNNNNTQQTTTKTKKTK